MARFRGTTTPAGASPLSPPLAGAVPAPALATAAGIVSVRLVEVVGQAPRQLTDVIKNAFKDSARALPDLFGKLGGKDKDRTKDKTDPGKDRGDALGDLLSSAKQAAVGLLAFKSVALAAPGTMQRFNIALEDSTAVIGQRLAPVFEQVVIPAVRLFGDFLTSILPSADDFADVLAPVTDFLNELRKALAAVAPVIKDVLVVGLRALGEALKLVLWPIRVLTQFVQEVLGIEGKARLGSSAGAAARTIRFEDPLSAVKSVYQAAFQARGGIGGEKKEKTPLDKIDESVRVAVDVLKSIFAADAPLGGLLRTIASIVKDIYNAVAPVVTNIFDPDEGWGAKIGDQIGEIIWPGNKNQPPNRPPERVMAAEAAAQAAKAVGQAATGQTGVSGFLRLPELVEALRQALRTYGRSAEATEEEIDIVLRDARRRALDGTH